MRVDGIDDAKLRAMANRLSRGAQPVIDVDDLLQEARLAIWLARNRPLSLRVVLAHSAMVDHVRHIHRRRLPQRNLTRYAVDAAPREAVEPFDYLAPAHPSAEDEALPRVAFARALWTLQAMNVRDRDAVLTGVRGEQLHVAGARHGVTESRMSQLRTAARQRIASVAA